MDAGLDTGAVENPVRYGTVWGLPVRLFHWSLVVLFAFSWWSGKARMLDWHRRSGLVLLSLVVFRLLWGAFGSAPARFVTFVRGPRRVFAYIRFEMFRRDSPSFTGHNPVGGWSVLALLAALLCQTCLGMFAVDVDGIESGPLASHVSFDTGRLAARMHGILFNVLLALIGLHIAAVLFYLVYKRTNLIWPILRAPRSARDINGLPAGLIPRAALLLVASAAVVYLVITLGS